MILIVVSFSGCGWIFNKPDPVSDYTLALSGAWNKVEYFVGGVDCTSVL